MSDKTSVKKDYSAKCNLNDEDKSNDCFNCSRFCFPIGCMVGGEDGEGRKQLIKVTQADVIVQKTDSGPYYLIKYKEVGKDDYTLGYGSYNFDFVLDWLSEEFEVVKDNVTQFPVNMDEMQRDIMIELLNARKECTEQNLLTARGCVAMIDALFYLVKEGVHIGIDMGDPKGDKTGGLE